MSASCTPPSGDCEKKSCAKVGTGGSDIYATGELKLRKTLSKLQRLSDSSAFDDAFREGTPFVGKYMVMRQRFGEGAELRLGVIVSKRTLRRSVDRSRAKRLLREAYRLNRHLFKPDCDVVLIGRRPLVSSGISDVEQELLRLAKKGGLLR